MQADWLPLLQEVLDIAIGKQAENPESPVLGALLHNDVFVQQRTDSMNVCGDCWGLPPLSEENWNDLFIQHFLATILFKSLLPKSADWQSQTAIARHFQAMIEQLFTKKVQDSLQKQIQTYSDWLKQNLDSIPDFSKKIDFLRDLIAPFYAFPTPQKQIPSSVFSFFVQQTDHFLKQHFDFSLCDKGCRILDTNGIFHFALIPYLPAGSLKSKYENDIYIHNNWLLEHYISSIEINAILKQKKQADFSFKNASWGNLFAEEERIQQPMLFAENKAKNELAEILNRQKQQTFSVIWLNFLAPMYPKWMGAKMPIDAAVKETFAAEHPMTKAQEPALRYLRWAIDSIDSQGIIAFITPRSFLENPAWVGLRQSLSEEMDSVYLVDSEDWTLWYLVIDN